MKQLRNESGKLWNVSFKISVKVRYSVLVK